MIHKIYHTVEEWLLYEKAWFVIQMISKDGCTTTTPTPSRGGDQ